MKVGDYRKYAKLAMIIGAILVVLSITCFIILPIVLDGMKVSEFKQQLAYLEGVGAWLGEDPSESLGLPSFKIFLVKAMITLRIVFLVLGLISMAAGAVVYVLADKGIIGHGGGSKDIKKTRKVKCPECGEVCPANAAHCPYCGKKLVIVETPPRYIPCSACGTKNSVGARFCSKCGDELGKKIPDRPEEVSCRACGAKNSGGARYCSKCGAEINGTVGGGGICCGGGHGGGTGIIGGGKKPGNDYGNNDHMGKPGDL